MNGHIASTLVVALRHGCARARGLVAIPLVWASLACSDGTSAPARGSLAVVIAGLPDGQPASVTVTGPGNTSKALTATATIDDLAAGSYDIRADNVTAGDVVYTATPAAQSVAVMGGSQATATVSYTSSTFSLRAQQIVEGLANPVYLTAPKNDPRLFIVEQPGRIRIVKDGALLATPFLDITARVVSGGERGLLSLAFDPAYATNGRFYVYYTGAQGDIFIDRFTVSGNPDIANTTSDPVLTIQHRVNANHNGGLLLFGPDGMLYAGVGDGGGAGDVPNNAQNIDVLLGKILRVNVATLPYTIPAGNPFSGQAGADEIWAYGLRNPWRFAFDVPPDGSPPQLYIADVGQGAREEVDVADASAAGRNYGWHTMEGTQCYNPSTGCNQAGLTLPVLDYDHGQGCSITGGFVYRGAAIPEIRGLYFYSDYCSGWLRSFRLSSGTAVEQRDWAFTNIGNVTSFGVDGAGELYMLSTSGRVYRVVKQ
ncbi:MAG TPA: PQQ-dependent sugar dehydrogenase [Gemmatimonadaceae bacterium]|nr:PQQ-dependent sugar dehydrogenase [Gemmatimonadaceae bacterium]